MAAAPGPASPTRPLVLAGAGESRWLDPVAVAWVQAAGKQVRIRHGDEVLLQAGTLAEFEQRLQGAGFARVHRGCIVNLAHVTGRRRRAHGDAWLVLRDGSTVPLSRRYARALDARVR